MSAPAGGIDRGKAFVHVLSCVLSRLVASNDGSETSPAAAMEAEGHRGVVTKFHALRPPAISILDYCARIHKYASCSPECFVLALVYIDRLIQRNNILLNSLNVHRIIITAVMMAAKFFDDHYFNNAYYAKVGGVPTNEVNSLELEFLFSINFSLHVPTDVYERYYSELASHMGVGAADGGSSNACDCARFAPVIGYLPEELLNTGMRDLHTMMEESLAAAATTLVDGMSTMTVDDAMMGGTASTGSTAAVGMEVESDVPHVGGLSEECVTLRRMDVPAGGDSTAARIFGSESGDGCCARHTAVQGGHLGVDSFHSSNL